MGRSIDRELVDAGMMAVRVKTKKVLLVLPERYVDALRNIGSIELWRTLTGIMPDEEMQRQLAGEVKISPMIRRAIEMYVKAKQGEFAVERKVQRDRERQAVYGEEGLRQPKPVKKKAAAAADENPFLAGQGEPVLEPDPSWEDWNRMPEQGDGDGD